MAFIFHVCSKVLRYKDGVMVVNYMKIMNHAKALSKR